MIGHPKPRWCQLPESFDAFLKIKNALAFPAVKMMMMPLVRSLVARRLSGNLDAARLTISHEVFQGAVNSGDAKRGGVFPGELMDFFRTQRTILFFENGLDGLFLPGGASVG